MHYNLWADGACSNNGKKNAIGGWAYVILQGGRLVSENSGGEKGTTNQRMELTAALNACKEIEKLDAFARVKIYSDSAYLINCYEQEWWVNWKNNGWRNANKKEVANQDLWWELIPYFEKFGYDLRKVKGHSTSVWNNKCDELAQKAAEEAKINWRGKENE